jgi:predicted nucleic acid-binding protein
MASEGLFKPKWSSIIQEEWTRNLLINRPDLIKKQLKSTIDSMNKAFPDSNVENFEELIPNLNLPDENDRHVLACAIQCKADLITTINLKDFPTKRIDKYDIQIQHPDELICNLIDLNERLACKAFEKMVNRLKNPPKTKSEVRVTLTNCGLIESAKRLEKIC